MDELLIMLGPLERVAEDNRCLLPDLRMETDSVYKGLCFIVSILPDDGQSTKFQ
jgi:hypothetical protein